MLILKSGESWYNSDIRWKQRLQNYHKAMVLLERALQIPQPDIFQKAGIIQFFEVSFELGWKLLKDYLEAQGFADVQSPRSSLKKAFEVGILTDGHMWLEMLTDRNLSTHTYDEQKTNQLEMLIRNRYFDAMQALHDYLMNHGK